MSHALHEASVSFNKGVERLKAIFKPSLPLFSELDQCVLQLKSNNKGLSLIYKITTTIIINV